MPSGEDFRYPTKSSYEPDSGENHQAINPVQKGAQNIRTDEYDARTAVNDHDRNEALARLQDDVGQLNKEGFEFAKSVYQDLRNSEQAQCMPLVELTYEGLSVKASKELQTQVAQESRTPGAQESIRIKQELRRDYGLPTDANEQSLQDAISKQEAADLRKSYGLLPNATDKELQAAELKQEAADLRKSYGLLPNATDKELQAAELKYVAADSGKN